ncbi:MAG: hypothetical protein M3419_05985 [Actinomycetota bacterium]|nr:hypothetical protein [Actinomycetota bacterium]
MAASDVRPIAVTYACLIAGASSVLTLVNIFVLLGDWGSLEVRQQIEQAFADAPFGSGGYSVEAVVEFLRIAAMAAAACCVAAVVLSVFTARRDRAARLVLTVLAVGWVLVSLLLGVPGLLLALLGGLCVALLWRPEARAWFAGPASDRVPAGDPASPGQHVPTRTDRRTTNQETSMTTPPSDSPSGQSSPYGQQPRYPGASQPPQYGGQYGGQYGQQDSGYPQYGGDPGVRRDRPGGVTAASVITIVFSVLTGGFWLVAGLAMLLASDSIVEALEDSSEGRQVLREADITVTELTDGISVVGVVALLAAVLMLLAIWPAIGVLRGGGTARIFLVIASVVTAIVGVVFTLLGALIGLIWVAAGIAVAVLLFTGGASTWFDYKAHERSAR